MNTDTIELPRERLLSRSEVQHLLGVGRTTFYRMIKRGDFPPPLTIGARCTGWTSGPVLRWIQKRELRAREDHMRRRLARQKCELRKSKDHYDIVAIDDDGVVLAGERFDLTIEDVERWIDDEAPIHH